jgi:hypothetical protein
MSAAGPRSRPSTFSGLMDDREARPTTRHMPFACGLSGPRIAMPAPETGKTPWQTSPDGLSYRLFALALPPLAIEIAK